MALVLVAAALMRLGALERLPLIVTNDGNAYYEIAARLWTFSEDAWFDPWRTPGYPLWLSIVGWALGDTPQSFILGQAILGLTAVAVYFRLSERVGSSAVAVPVGLYLGLNPATIVLEHSLLSEPLAMLTRGLAALAMVGVLERGDSGNWRGRAVVTGGLLGCCALVRPSDSLLIPAALLAAMAAWSHARWHRGSVEAATLVRATAWMTLSSCVVLAPWLVHGVWRHGHVGLSGNANISRLVFAVREGLFSPTDARLLELVPSLPKACAANRDNCGWQVVGALRARVKTEYELDALAGQLVNRQIVAHPFRYVEKVGRVGLMQVGAMPGRWAEVDFLVTGAVEPEVYRDIMASAKPPWSRQSVQNSAGFGRYRRLFTFLYVKMFQWRTPVVWVVFFLGLPWAVHRTGARLLAIMVGTVALALCLILAPVDRYMILNEPLELIVGLGGLQVLIVGQLGSVSRKRRGAVA
jgi:hypothetical protein